MTNDIVTNPPALRIFYDAECPVCTLTWKNKAERLQSHAIELIGIRKSTALDTAKRYGIPPERDMLSEIYGVRADGEILTGMDVFYEVYRLTGAKWYVRLMSYPPQSYVVSFLYKLFAQRRMTVAKLLGMKSSPH